MKVMKWSAIALAVSAGSTQFAVADAFVSDQAEAKGFIEDSSLNLLLRNYYFNRDGKEGRGDRVDWTQGFLTTYESGFTQGTVGFGVDAFGYLGLKLDGTSDKTGTGNLPVMNDGKPRDDYSRAGGAVKVRISKTMLKWGEMQPTAPVFAAGGSRLFPQTATGFQLQSSEFEGLDLEAGHFTEGKEPTTVKSRGELYATYAGQTAKSADFAGGRYAITDNLSASLYGAELKDIYRQYYLNTNYTIPLASDQSLGFDFNIYRTTDEGKSKAGDISNTTWSLAGAYTLDAHTFHPGLPAGAWRRAIRLHRLRRQRFRRRRRLDLPRQLRPVLRLQRSWREILAGPLRPEPGLLRRSWPDLHAALHQW